MIEAVSTPGNPVVVCFISADICKNSSKRIWKAVKEKCEEGCP